MGQSQIQLIARYRSTLQSWIVAEKWGRRLFRIGAVMLLLIGLVHARSLFNKPIPTNDTEKQLLDLMTNYRFNLLGSVRTIFDLLQGFRVAFRLAALGIGTLDLVLLRERTRLLKQVSLVNALWLALMTGVSLHYFFLAPTSLLAIALLIFLLAWLKLPGKTPEAPVHSR